MSNLRVFLVVLSLFCISNARQLINRTDFDPNDRKLIFAHIIFRHGDRNILDSYPNDPWKDEAQYWPEGFGQLTNMGIQQEYQLGLYLRERYQSLLGDGGYSDKIIYVQSTDYDRTLMSAESVMAAMFPPEGEQIWNDDLLWQPVPIHTVPTQLDTIVYIKRPCPSLDQAKQSYFASAEMVETLAKYEQLFKYLEDNAGTPINTISQASDLYDTLWIEHLKNKTLPKWTESVFGPDTDLEYVHNLDFKVKTGTPEIARYSVGFLIRDILDRCSKKVQKSLSPDRSMWIYSAHDSTIVNILNAFGQFDLHQPSYTSSLHFDLFESKDKTYLQVSYRNSSGEMILAFPYCGTQCSIKDLQRIYQDIIPTESFEDECRHPITIKPVEKKSDCAPSINISLIILICLGLTLPIILTLSCMLFNRKRGNMKMDTDNTKN